MPSVVTRLTTKTGLPAVSNLRRMRWWEMGSVRSERARAWVRADDREIEIGEGGGQEICDRWDRTTTCATHENAMMGPWS